MASEYEWMLPADQDRKIAKFERDRQAWIATRSRGKVRFILWEGTLRLLVLAVLLTVFEDYVAQWRLSIALMVRVTFLVLLSGPLFNLVEWHWNDRRYPPRPNQNQQSALGSTEPR